MLLFVSSIQCSRSTTKDRDKSARLLSVRSRSIATRKCLRRVFPFRPSQDFNDRGGGGRRGRRNFLPAPLPSRRSVSLESPPSSQRGKKALKSLINRAWRQTGDRCTATMHRPGCAARSTNRGANVVSCKRADPALGHPSLPITYRGRWHC